MFVISRLMYESVYFPGDLLVIDPREEKNHQGTFYKFRFGALDDLNKPGEIKTLNIRAGEFKKIWTLERFTLRERVLGLFGSPSSLIKQGLQILHSPFIDPGYDARLLLGIKNNAESTLELEPGAEIGKIMFFDISDTLLPAEAFFNNKLEQNAWNERTEVSKLLQDTYNQYVDKKKHNK